MINFYIVQYIIHSLFLLKLLCKNDSILNIDYTDITIIVLHNKSLTYLKSLLSFHSLDTTIITFTHIVLFICLRYVNLNNN